ncbi:MAG: type II toxin-antitoxin system Phd/YefM family antitoxin [Acidiferrobacterales bacterium]
MEISIRELKNHLSKYLRRVAAGEEVIITSHNHPVARLIAVTKKGREANALARRLRALPGVRWNGKRPRGGQLRPKVTGKTAGDLVLEDRR